MASKEAKADATEASSAAAAPVYAFEFKLLKDKIGEKTTNKQVKAKVNEAFLGYGAFDECRVAGDAGADRVVTVFFARLFGKGQPAWDTLTRGEEASVQLYDEQIALRKSDAKPSGGGATTGTSFRPKKEAPKGEKKGARRAPAGEAKDGKDGKPAAAGAGAGDAKDAKDGKDGKDRKDGGRGRGRGKKEEVKGPSLQRGRANIGGKLGPVSKVRLAKQAKEAKAKEAKDRADRGEKPLEEEDKKDDEKTADGLPPPRKTDDAAGKKESGKKGDAKKEGGKKEAGKAEGGKKEGGKKEAGKAEGKKEAGKKGK